MNQYRLFFDIETQAAAEALAFMPTPEAPGNLKDPAKIAAAIEEKKQEQIDRAALDPDYGKLLSIGYAYHEDDDVIVKIADEVTLLECFWEAFVACNGRAVGYNIIGFDLPYLMRRSLAMKVNVPIVPFLAKYRTEPVTDLMGILYNWDRAKSLKLVAKLYGLEVLAEGVDGSQVSTLKPDQLALYQKSDVYLVQQLFKRMNGVYFGL